MNGRASQKTWMEPRIQVMTGDFAVNPVAWTTVATLAKTTGTGPDTKALIDKWK